MAEPLKVILKTFAEPGGMGFGSPTITMTADVTDAVKNIDIDPTCFIDEDTLLVSERKCSITLINRYNIYKTIKDKLTDIEEDITTTEYNYNNLQELDGESGSRYVKFIYPYIRCNHSKYTTSLIATSEFYYPVIYKEPTDGRRISYIPILEFDENNNLEDRYINYDNAYKKERPKYHNLLIEVYFYDILQYVGIALINTLKFNIKTNEISIDFTDPIGVMIDCLNKINSFPNFYQGIVNTGLAMDFLYDLPRRTIEMFYHRLKNLFNFRKFLGRITANYRLFATCKYGSHFAHTFYDFIVYDEDTEIFNSEDPIGGHGANRDPRNSNRHPNEGFSNYWQYKKYIYYKVCKDGSENEPEIHIIFFEIYRKRSGSNWTNDYAYIITRIRIILGNTNAPYFMKDSYGKGNGFFATWDIFFNAVITNTLATAGGTWIKATMDENWDTGSYPTNITSTLYYAPIPDTGYYIHTNTLTYNQNLYNAYNDEGFNEQLSLLDAFKLHLLSRVDTVYSKGYDIIRKPFKNSTAGSGYYDFGINGRYVKELTIEPTYYEKPDLSAIEMIANWEGKKRAPGLTTLVNLKDWTYELMETFPSGNAQKVKVTFIIGDNTYSDLELGNKVKISPLYNCFPDEPDTNELYFIVTSIKWNIMELELEGFRVAS